MASNIKYQSLLLSWEKIFIFNTVTLFAKGQRFCIVVMTLETKLSNHTSFHVIVYVFNFVHVFSLWLLYWMNNDYNLFQSIYIFVQAFYYLTFRLLLRRRLMNVLLGLVNLRHRKKSWKGGVDSFKSNCIILCNNLSHYLVLKTPAKYLHLKMSI